MKNENVMKADDLNIDAKTINVINQITASLCILNNRYNMGCMLCLDLHSKDFYANIFLPGHETRTCNVSDMLNPNAIKRLEMYSNYLKAYIKDHPFV